MNNHLNVVMNSNVMRSIKQQRANDKKMAVKLKTIGKIMYPLKRVYNPVIPLNIYQTWWTKDLPPLMKKSLDEIIKNNPAFKHHLFDDNDCRNFIKDNFSTDILNAYDTLIPGAYKADLWRYCVLYKNGGIYLDIKYKPYNEFKFINLTEKEHWVLDADNNGIYNALMVCKPNNPVLLQAINRVVQNVNARYYGKNSLCPTGPQMLSDFFDENSKNNFDMKHEYFVSIENRVILFNDIIIFKSYKGYLDEQVSNKKTEHYSGMWKNSQIYH